MAKSVARELSEGVEGSSTSLPANVAACTPGSFSSRGDRVDKGDDVDVVSGTIGTSAVSAAPIKTLSMTWQSCTEAGARVEVVQLEAKGKALTKAVNVLENVLHEMETQVSLHPWSTLGV